MVGDFQVGENLGAANWVGALIHRAEGSFMQLPSHHRWVW